MKNITILLLGFIFVSSQAKSHGLSDVLVLVKSLGLKSPNIIEASKYLQIKSVKEFSKANYIISSSQDIHEIEDTTYDMIIFINDQVINDIKKWPLNPKSFDSKTVLIISDSKNIYAIKRLIHFGFHQEVYFYDTSTNDVTEHYQINKVSIERSLGFLGLKDGYHYFYWENDIINNFFRRRSNFHGMKLKGLVGHQTSFMELQANYKLRAKYVRDDKTFLVNGYTYGTFNDVIEMFEERLNLTMNLFKQEVEEWGDIYIDPNGSTVITGMVGAVYQKKADIVATSLSITTSRAKYLSFLLPIGSEVLTMVVSREAVTESFDFLVFLRPLHLNLWFMIFGMAIFATLTKTLTTEGRLSTLRYSYRDFWETLMTCFGGTFQSLQSNKESYKLAVLTSLLSGYLIWMNYNAFLTSELLVVEKLYPFTNLKELSNTNWRLYTTFSKGSSIGSALIKSSSPTYNQVYNNNMDDNSFTGIKKGIAKVLSKSKNVYLHYEDIIRETKAYKDCEIEEIPWKQTIGYISMAVSKDSPMRKFLDMVILEMIDTGILHKSRLKWSIKKTDCKNEAKPTSIQKVILTFIIISFGMIFALFTMMLEKMIRKIHPRKKVQPKYNYIREELKVNMKIIRNCKDAIPNEKLRNLIRNIGQNILQSNHERTRFAQKTT